MQVAALLSKPKKKASNFSKLRKQERMLKRKLRKLRGDLIREGTDLLADSLDKDKLGAEPYDVATEITDYIRSGQNGWDCPPAENIAQMSLNLLDSPYINSVQALSQIFIPYSVYQLFFLETPAFSDVGGGKSPALGEDEKAVAGQKDIEGYADFGPGEKQCIKSGGTLKDGEGCNCSKTIGKILVDDKCVCEGNKVPVKDNNKQCKCPDDKPIWNSSTKNCEKKKNTNPVQALNRILIPYSVYQLFFLEAPAFAEVGDGTPPSLGETEEAIPGEGDTEGYGELGPDERQCLNSGGKPIDGKCDCSATIGKILQGNKCICEGNKKPRGKTRCECPDDKPTWNYSTNKCEAQRTPTAENNECNISGGKPNRGGTCDCREAKGKKQTTDRKKCEPCPSGTTNWFNGQCFTCSGNTPKWNTSTKQCEACLSSTPHWVNDQCICDTRTHFKENNRCYPKKFQQCKTSGGELDKNKDECICKANLTATQDKSKCVKRTCDQGHGLTDKGCIRCTGNKYSVENKCQPCGPGKKPNQARTACICDTRTHFKENNRCYPKKFKQCKDSGGELDKNKDECICRGQLTTTQDKSKCVKRTCDPGHGLNRQGQCARCTGDNYSLDNKCQPCGPGKKPNQARTACVCDTRTHFKENNRCYPKKFKQCKTSGGELDKNKDECICRGQLTTTQDKSKCVKRTCDPGHGLNRQGQCARCTGDNYSLDNKCQPCGPGKKPNQARTACVCDTRTHFKENNRCYPKKFKQCKTSGGELDKNKDECICKGNLTATQDKSKCVKRTCDPGHGLNQQGQCTRCTGNTYSVENKCVPCKPPKAVIENNTKCVKTTCKPGHELTDKGCIRCTGNKYSVENKCVPCKPPKKTTQDKSKCVKRICDPGHGLNQRGQCTRCTGNNYSVENKCVPCKPPKAVIENNTKCVKTTCKPGHELTDKGCIRCTGNNYSVENKCVPCKPPKKTTQDKSKCVKTTCKPGHELTDKGCIRCTGNNYSVENKCVPCKPPKKTTQDKSKCVKTTCKPGHELTDKGCIRCTGNNYSVENKCVPCKPPKKTTQDKSKCVKTTCKPGHELTDKGCIRCTGNNYSVENKCVPCKPPKKTTQDKSKCVKTTPQPSPSPQKCDGPNEYPNPDGKGCKSCGTNEAVNKKKDGCTPCEGKGVIKKNNKCKCKDGYEQISDAEPLECVKKCKEGYGRIGDGDCKEKCPKWKTHRAFRNGGRVAPNFCDTYATQKGKCKEALYNIEKYRDEMNELKNKLSQLEDRISEAKLKAKEDESKTEASGLCTDCLKQVLRASRPTTAQTIGNILQTATGVGIGLMGYNFGKKAQYDANMLRIEQGYAPTSDGFSLAGAQAGFPFMSRGLYGMTRANTPIGGWSCSPAMSPHNRGFNIPYLY